MRKLLKRRILDFYSLLVGLRVTLRHLFKPAITLQYPKERWVIPERSRGRLALTTDPATGELKCNGCRLCAIACPVNCIEIKTSIGEDKKRVLDEYNIDFGLCMFCGLCVEACQRDALKFVGDYEYSTSKREQLIWDKEALKQVWVEPGPEEVHYVREWKSIP